MTKIITINADIFCEIFHSETNKTMELSRFSFCMKMADVTALYTKGSRSIKDNYHSVNILSNLSKVFERCLFEQVLSYLDKILSKKISVDVGVPQGSTLDPKFFYIDLCDLFFSMKYVDIVSNDFYVT